MIFLDTGAFLARYITKDQYHDPAIVSWEKIFQEGIACFTSNFVLNEVFTLLARRTTYEFAARKAQLIYGSEKITTLRPSEADEILAIQYLKKYADQAVSFTDCLSFVLMKKKKIRTAFSFDIHFQFAGFSEFT